MSYINLKLYVLCTDFPPNTWKFEQECTAQLQITLYKNPQNILKNGTA